MPDQNIVKQQNIAYSRLKVTANLPLSLYREYLRTGKSAFERSKNIRHPTSLFPKNKQGRQPFRIYFKPQPGGRLLLLEPPTAPEVIDPRVLAYIPTSTWSILDPVLGTLINKHTGKRSTISRILTEQHTPKNVLSLWINDTDRQVFIEATQPSQRLVVISRHPYDILGMSFDRGWRSCMKAGREDVNNRPLLDDIAAGSLIAYLVEGKDRNVHKPIARIRIHRYEHDEKSGRFLYVPGRTYGTTALGVFRRQVLDYLHRKHNSRQPLGNYTLASTQNVDEPLALSVSVDKKSWANVYSSSDIDVVDLLGPNGNKIIPTFRQIQSLLFLAYKDKEEYAMCLRLLKTSVLEDPLALLLIVNRGIKLVRSLSVEERQHFVKALDPYIRRIRFVTAKGLQLDSALDPRAIIQFLLENSASVPMMASKIASNPWLPEDEATFLLQQFPPVVHYLAANHHLSREWLTDVYNRFHDDQRVINAIAGNIATDPEILKQIGPDSKRLLQNPAIPESVVVEAIGLQTKRARDNLQILAVNPGPAVQKHFAKLFSNLYLRSLLSANEGLETSDYQQLFDTQDNVVLGVLAVNTRVPISILRQLVMFHDVSVADQLFCNRTDQLPAELQQQIALSNIKVPFPAYVAMSQYSMSAKNIHLAVAGKPGQPGLFSLLDPKIYVDNQILKALLENEKLLPETLTLLANRYQSVSHIQQQLAFHRRMPDHLAYKISKEQKIPLLIQPLS